MLGTLCGRFHEFVPRLGTRTGDTKEVDGVDRCHPIIDDDLESDLADSLDSALRSGDAADQQPERPKQDFADSRTHQLRPPVRACDRAAVADHINRRDGLPAILFVASGRAQHDCSRIVMDRDYRLIVRGDVDVPPGMFGLEGILRGLIKGRLLHALLHEPNEPANDYDSYDYAHAPSPFGANPSASN